jgi:carboxymethylenebutenolidase
MGGVSDEQVVGDVKGAMEFLRALPTLNGKVGVFGTCSGGRHAFLAACKCTGFDAVIDCWGGRVVAGKEELTAKQPVAPVDYTAELSCPVLGLFGEEDRNPTPEHVAKLEEVLKEQGKTYEFHMYPAAGHGFFYHDRGAYRQEQAVDGWKKIFAFGQKYLGAPGA